MKKIFLVSSLIGALLVSSSEARAQELSIDLHGAVALVNYSNLTVSGGMGSNFGSHPVFFFHKSLGFFTGFDYITRPMTLNDASSTKWLEIPVGLAFRGSPESSYFTGLGLSYGMPLSNFKDSSAAYETNGGLSLLLVTNRYYEIDPSFSLGIYTDIRYSFHSPFADADLAAGRIFSFDIGLGARFNL